MKIAGSQRIAAAPNLVWAALNDPEVLKACIPGCESVERVSAERFTAVIKRKIGPVNARFTGEIALSDVVEGVDGASCTITGEGKGGAAGLAKGSADVRIAAAEDGALLTYEAEARLSGKIAQLGARVMDAFAKKTAAAFFATFGEVVGSDETPDGSAAGTG